MKPYLSMYLKRCETKIDVQKFNLNEVRVITQLMLEF